MIGAASGALIGGAVTTVGGGSFWAGAGMGAASGAITGFTGGVGVAAGMYFAPAISNGFSLGTTGGLAVGGSIGGFAGGVGGTYLSSLLPDASAPSLFSYALWGGLGAISGGMSGLLSGYNGIRGAEFADTVNSTNKSIFGTAVDQVINTPSTPHIPVYKPTVPVSRNPVAHPAHPKSCPYPRQYKPWQL